MRTDKGREKPADQESFTQTARRAQLVGCAVDALAHVGYQQTTVAEVARRAGVSKGVVTYYFPARDDLVRAVVAAVFGSVAERVGSRLGDVPPERYVAAYLGAWIDYYRTNRREMMALTEIWPNFRDAEGRPQLDARTLEPGADHGRGAPGGRAGGGDARRLLPAGDGDDAQGGAWTGCSSSWRWSPISTSTPTVTS